MAFGDVGSSIIYALGVVAALAFGATPLAIGIAGVFFIMTAFTYAELGATIPEAGGAQIFARRAFGDLISFIAGWALLLDYVLTATISAYTIWTYVGPRFLPSMATMPWTLAVAAGVLVLLGALNVLGIRESTRLSLWLSSLALATFTAIVVWGLFTVFDARQFVSQLDVGVKPTWGQFFHAVVMSMVAYIGIEAGTQLAGEAENPGRTVPKAIKWSVIAVLVSYAGLCAVAMCIPGMPDDLGTRHNEQPLTAIAGALPGIGPWLSAWMAVLAAVVLFVATNAGLIGASRLAYSMSTHYQLPGLFRHLHPTRRTPWAAVAFFTAAAGLVLLVPAFARGSTGLEALAQLYNFGSMLAFTMAHLALIGLRIREPDLQRPYKVPLNVRIAGREIPMTALLGLAATATAWIVVVILHPTGRWVGFAWIALGLGIYLLFRRRQHMPVVQSVRIEHVAIPEFSDWAPKRILVPTRGGPSTEVVQSACKIARESGAEVVAIYVLEIPAQLPLETFLPDRFAQGDEALARAQAIAREYGVSMQVKMQQARSAGETILQVAKDENCDLIVLGAAARRPGSTGFPLGAAVETVLRGAKCRVWVCTSG